VATKPRTSPLPGAKQTPARRPGSRSARRIAAERAAQRRRVMVFGAVGVALLAALVLVLNNLPDSESGSNLPAVVAAAEPFADVPADGRSLGDPNAPVVVVEYGDYQCPACAQADATLVPQLVEEYVTTGLVRFEFHDYAFLDGRVNGSESHDAAAAAFCANDQGAFWRYHTTLYTNQQRENVGGFSQERLRAMAVALGLNADQFNDCLNDGTYEDAVAAANAEADALNLGGTPSFTVDGVVIDYSGYDSLKAAIEAALTAAGVAR
jgi:protein-disulfide isomerase